MIDELRQWVWLIAKWSAIFAFICMDWTHSFPKGSWAQTFDTLFNIGVAVWLLLTFVEAVVTAKVTRDAR